MLLDFQGNTGDLLLEAEPPRVAPEIPVSSHGIWILLLATLGKGEEGKSPLLPGTEFQGPSPLQDINLKADLHPNWEKPNIGPLTSDSFRIKVKKTFLKSLFWFRI